VLYTAHQVMLGYYGGVVLGFGTVWFHRSIPMFWRNMLSPSSGLK
jgi:hypothetical protein